MFDARDEEILVVLACRVRLLTLGQIARTWWPQVQRPISAARTRLRKLELAGYVRPFAFLSHPELTLRVPAVTWAPGQPAPNTGEVAYRLQTRWTLPQNITETFLAGRKAANHFGGYLRPFPKEVEQNHEVHVSSVFLWYRTNRPTEAEAWHSEAWIKKSRPDAPGEKLPDAMIRLHKDRKVVEFGGAYPKERVAAFHEFCDRRSLRYELW